MSTTTSFRKKGKLKAIPVLEVTDGMQLLMVESDGSMGIITSRSTGVVTHLLEFKYQWLTTLVSSVRILNDAVQLKTLVVEHQQVFEFEEDPSWNKYETTQFPLHTDQWAEAISINDVDSGIDRDFTTVTRHKIKPDGSLMFGHDYEVAVMLPKPIVIETWETIREEAYKIWKTDSEASQFEPWETWYIEYLETNFHPPKSL